MVKGPGCRPGGILGIRLSFYYPASTAPTKGEIMKEVLQFIQTNKVFFMATVDGDRPRLRPLGFVMEYDGKIYFGVGDQKEVFSQMKTNPKVDICSVSPNGNWLRLSGKAVFDMRPELFEAAVKTLPVLGEMYSPSLGNKLGTFYLTEAKALIYDMAGNTQECSI